MQTASLSHSAIGVDGAGSLRKDVDEHLGLRAQQKRGRWSPV
jgi:hypothetical protein